MSEAAAAPVEPTNGDADKKKGGKREERKKDETPIEELYDLTQPIPKVRSVISLYGGLLVARIVPYNLLSAILR